MPHPNAKHQRRSDSHNQIETRLQAFVALVVDLLVEDAAARQQPHHPAGVALDRQRQPGIVGASYEDVDHCPVAAMEHVLQVPEIKVQLSSISKLEMAKVLGKLDGQLIVDLSVE